MFSAAVADPFGASLASNVIPTKAGIVIAEASQDKK
jgi:hypothetical protein